MRRALSSSWTVVRLLGLTLLWIGWVASPAFAGKPTIAILGLEVVDTSGAVDAEAVKVAKELTDGLRARAKVGSGPYVLAPGSDKELIDEKLIKNCDTEAMPCMAQIGKDLGANYLMYGRLEKKGDGYQVQINLLNIDKKKFEKSKSPLTIPFGQKDSASLAASAKRVYNDLTGVQESGAIVVTSNVPDGEVFLDEQSKGKLNGGSLTIDRLGEGRYRLAIQHDKYQRSEVVVTVRNGESTPQTLNLTPIGDPKHEIYNTTSGKKSNYWKYAAIGLGVATAATGVAWIYGYSKIRGRDDGAIGDQLGADADGRTEEDCPKADYRTRSAAFDDVCSGYDTTRWAVPVTLILGVGTAVTTVLAIRASGGEEAPPPTTGARRTSKKKNAVSITPVISPEGGGATFRIDW